MLSGHQATSREYTETTDCKQGNAPWSGGLLELPQAFLVGRVRWVSLRIWVRGIEVYCIGRIEFGG